MKEAGTRTSPASFVGRIIIAQNDSCIGKKSLIFPPVLCVLLRTASHQFGMSHLKVITGVRR